MREIALVIGAVGIGRYWVLFSEHGFSAWWAFGLACSVSALLIALTIPQSNRAVS